MKLLTVAIPCYNSAEYMGHAIENAAAGGDDVEVLIVDDGSTKDNTFETAKEYEAKYPGIVRAIHQENKGHGGAVMTGLREASGLYYKVCDSDDWFDENAYPVVLKELRKIAAGSREVDAVICNYVYDKVGAEKKKEIHYTHSFPERKIFTWTEMKHALRPDTYVLMHALIYRTDLLKGIPFDLPEHTFYVDNLVAFTPMIYVKTMYYIDVPLYRYYIGREDQSVNEKVMMGRIDQQLLVTRLMIDSYEPHMVTEKQHLNFLVHYMGIMMSVSSILLLRINTPESLQKKKELWRYLRNKDRRLYVKIRLGLLGQVVNIPGKLGRKITVKGYAALQKRYGFN